MERKAPRSILQSALKKRRFRLETRGYIDTFRRGSHTVVVDFREHTVTWLSDNGGRILRFDAEELTGTELCEFIMERLDDR